MSLLEDSFKGKRVLVTGAGRGVGRAIVHRLSKYGAVVYALSKSPENLKSLKLECPEIETICVNLSNWEETRAALLKLETIDCLVNNAAMTLVKSIMNATPQQFDEIFSINTKAVMNTAQIIAQKLIADGKPGSIVNISSTGGLRPFPLCAVYGTSKAAMEYMSKCLAVELGRHKIRVNIVQPGAIDTDMIHEISEGCSKVLKKEDEELDQKIFLNLLKQRTPTQNPLMPIDQVVNTVLFLLSDLAVQITGQSLAVDGGFLCT